MDFIINNLNIIRDQYLLILPKLELASLIISAVLLTSIIYIFVKFEHLTEKTDFWADVAGGRASRYSRRQTSRSWRKILKLIHSDDPDDWRAALLEADNVLDEALKWAGYQGADLNERLTNITADQLAVIKELREARQLVQRLRREPDFTLRKDEADEAVYIYGRAFRELRLLD